MSELIAEVKLPESNYGGATLTLTNCAGHNGMRMVELQALSGGWMPLPNARLTIDRASFVKVIETYLEHEGKHG